MGADWVARDAAVVWHGFTQIGAYVDNAPLVIDRAEGRELIDSDGRRYLDAISSLWVNTLGHRVPELAGGVRSPQAHDGDAVDLLGTLEPDLVVLVAEAGVGHDQRGAALGRRA
jgi:adenosylmethionine-8-amino-7-oxononanoate aminotransferase